MTCQELAQIWPSRWPRPSAQSNRQHAASVRGWGEENAEVSLENYRREMARNWGLAHPWQIKYLRAMWNDAVRDGLCAENPFSALRIAKPQKQRYFPSGDEVEALIRAAEEPLRSRIRFSAYTGLRLGEMLAVRPMDFHASDRRLEVHWQIDSRGERVERKGKLKKIWVTVPEEATEGLGHIDWVYAFDMELPGEFDQRLWPLTRYEHNKEWNALRKRLELPENFVWHSLRHHAATWFLDQGVSFEDVAIQLGHSDNGQQVRDTYGHMSRDKALDRLEAIVGAS